VDICTGSGFASPAGDKDEVDPETARNSAGGPSYLSYLAYNRNSAAGPGGDAASVAPSTIKEKEKPNEPSGSAEPRHRKRASIARPASVYSESRGSSPQPAAGANGAGKLKLAVRKPSPRAYFVHFVDHPEHFVRFLEAIAFARWGQKIDAATAGGAKRAGTAAAAAAAVNSDMLPGDAEMDKADRTAVWNTLIELYLTLSSLYLTRTPVDADRSKSMQAKASQVLKSGYEYDPTHALLVCSTRQFTEGLVLLWEKLGMYEDILRFWMDKEVAMAASSVEAAAEAKLATRPSLEVLKHLNRYGESNPQLYPLVLRFLTSTPALLQRHTGDLSAILEHIEREKIMPPLAVVQVLSRNGVASVGLVKQWLMRRITESKNEIDSVS
jgi:vacuolar protein sorting-associated protein 11